MSRTCARPGCDRVAVSTLSYNYGERVVWVDDLSAEAHPMVHDLCDDHAEMLRIPLGWERRDGRTASVRRGLDGAVALELRLPLKSA